MEMFFAGALWEEVAVHERNSAEVMVAGHSTACQADPGSLIVLEVTLQTRLPSGISMILV